MGRSLLFACNKFLYFIDKHAAGRRPPSIPRFQAIIAQDLRASEGDVAVEAEKIALLILPTVSQGQVPFPPRRIGGGFKLSTNNEDARLDALRINEYVTQQSRTMNFAYQQRKGPADLNQEIKMIEKKIRQCQKKIEDEKRRKEDSMKA